MRAVAWLVVLAGCGRFSFGEIDRGDAALADRDGNGGDGNGGDANTGDATPSCAGYDLCDGFEAPAIDTVTWSLDPGITLDTTRAHRGTQSAKLHTAAFGAGQSSYFRLLETKTITSGATTFWIRAWFWLSALPAPGNGLELISAERPGSAGDYMFVFSDRTTIYTQWGLTSRQSMTTVPVGAWFCAIFKVVRSSGNTGSLDLAGDPPPLTMPNAQTDGTQPMTIITIGPGFSPSNVPVAQPAFDVWVDDVIVHSSAVSCSD